MPLLPAQMECTDHMPLRFGPAIKRPAPNPAPSKEQVFETYNFDKMVPGGARAPKPPLGKWPFPNMAVDPGSVKGDVFDALKPGKIWQTASEVVEEWKFSKNARGDFDLVEHHLGKAVGLEDMDLRTQANKNCTAAEVIAKANAVEDRATIVARILAEKQKLRPRKQPAMLDVPKAVPTFDDCVRAIGDALKRGVDQNYIGTVLANMGAGSAAQLPLGCRAAFIDALRIVNAAQPKTRTDAIYDNRATGKREHWVGGRRVRIIGSKPLLSNWGAYQDLPCPF